MDIPLVVELDGEATDRATRLAEAIDRSPIVVLRDLELTEAAQVDLTGRLGLVLGHSRHGRRPRRPQVRHEYNRAFGGQPATPYRFNDIWHADLSWTPSGHWVTLLYAVQCDSRTAVTDFADTTSAIDRLDPAVVRKADGLRVHHHVAAARAHRHGLAPHHTPRRLVPAPVRRAVTRVAGRRAEDPHQRLVAPAVTPPPGACHPLVGRHRVTGQRLLRLGDHGWLIDGWSSDESVRYLDDLQQQAVAAADRYTHQWRTGDLLVWDNTRLLHRAGAAPADDGVRALRRTMAERMR